MLVIKPQERRAFIPIRKPEEPAPSEVAVTLPRERRALAACAWAAISGWGVLDRKPEARPSEVAVTLPRERRALAA